MGVIVGVEVTTVVGVNEGCLVDVDVADGLRVGESIGLGV